MTCILTEQRIVFFSSDWALLTLIAECFMLYLHPLQWQHTFVPLLSRQMLDFVMAPTSFLMGCHIDHFEEVSTVCFRLLLVLLFTCSAFDPLFFQMHLETCFCYLGLWEVKKLEVMEPYWCDHWLIGKSLLLYSLPFFSLQDNIMIFCKFKFHLGKNST